MHTVQAEDPFIFTSCRIYSFNEVIKEAIFLEKQKLHSAGQSGMEPSCLTQVSLQVTLLMKKDLTTGDRPGLSGTCPALLMSVQWSGPFTQAAKGVWEARRCANCRVSLLWVFFSSLSYKDSFPSLETRVCINENMVVGPVPWHSG